jgi:hypothetical protein
MLLQLTSFSSLQSCTCELNLRVKLLNSYPNRSWESRKHDDGSMFEGDWFVAGKHLPTGDVTYHLEGKY